MSNLEKKENLNIYEAIGKVAIEQGFRDYELEIRTGSSKGDNYMGVMWRVTVTENKSDKRLNVIVKLAPTNDAVRDKIPVGVIYEREIVAYNEIFKVLNAVQDAAGVSSDVKFNFVRCYYASKEPMKELLVLEDLNTQGFTTLGKLSMIKAEHTNLVIISLAKLHGLSLILKKRDPDEFQRLSNKCIPDVQVSFEDFKDFVCKSLNLAARTVENPLHKSKILQVRENYLDHWRKCLEGGTYSVICHGDSWMNNVMFKDKDGEPVEARLHDYQILRYGPPAADVLYFIFTSTSGEQRKAHYYTWLDLYHETLASVLKAYSYDIGDVFPREVFEEQIKRLGAFAFMAGISGCKPLSLEGEETMEVENFFSYDEMAPPTGAAYDRYLKKLTDIIADCIEYGLV